jgi:hypothetical protein
MSRKERKRRKGSFGIAAIILFSLLSLLAVIIPKMVYNSMSVERSFADREAAFWLAEGGVQLIKLRISSNPNWYTDLPHLPEDDRAWLNGTALGETLALRDGQIKIVREMGKSRFYSLGSIKGSRVIIKISGKGWVEL